MEKKRNYQDIISEQEFTLQNLRHRQGILADPQEDSPGDSEQDAGDEFTLGMNFHPGETDSMGDPDEETAGNGRSIIERPNDLVVAPVAAKYRVPSSAMAKSSDQPAPREDQDKSSSTH